MAASECKFAWRNIPYQCPLSLSLEALSAYWLVTLQVRGISEQCVLTCSPNHLTHSKADAPALEATLWYRFHVHFRCSSRRDLRGSPLRNRFRIGSESVPFGAAMLCSRVVADCFSNKPGKDPTVARRRCFHLIAAKCCIGQQPATWGGSFLSVPQMGVWLTERRGLLHVLHAMRMGCPNQTGSLQGHPRVNEGGLAGNDSGTGSGWQQSKQN